MSNLFVKKQTHFIAYIVSAASGLSFPTSIPPSLIELAMARQAREVGKIKVILKILLILSEKIKID
jgi:hypothetical protein